MEGQPLTLPVVMGAGLVDSLNPCAFALLMVFIATMLAMIQRRPDRAGERAARGWLLTHGGVYVVGIFITYLALGLGLLSSLEGLKLVSSTHFASRLAAFFALGLGLLALQEVLLPEWGTRMTAHVDHVKLKGMVMKLSFPALLLAGFLVGLCTVPCAGSVYLGVLALLSTQATFAQGLAYLVIYNLVFIAPLVIILGFSSSPLVYRRLARWQMHRRAVLKLATSAAAITVGIFTLLIV
ncbi:MAG TPA: cytochrome c biogenesis protein CcdA [Chloroflexia bacterium]